MKGLEYRLVHGAAAARASCDCLRTSLRGRVGRVLLALVLATAGCAANPAPQDAKLANQSRSGADDDHVPAFARQPYEPFSRASAVAIALREWRLFGKPVDDLPPNEGPPPTDIEDNPARQPGLWERVGEYWWEGVDPDQRASTWTGMHNSYGDEYPASSRGAYPWSAAFISYVMRIAGAGDKFVYSPSHSAYIGAAVRQRGGLVGHPIDEYAPKLGDLICAGRDSGKRVRYSQLPRPFPAHCEIIVDKAEGQLSAISGNVDAAVTLTHIPTLPDGRLGAVSDEPVDDRYHWIIVIEVLYDQ